MKRLGYILGGVSAAALLCALFLALTAPGLRLLATGATALSQGQLKLEGVDGRLAGTIRLKSLTLTTEFQSLYIEQMRLEWRPGALLRGRFEVDAFTARELRIEEVKPDPDPLVAPDSLRLPLTLLLHRFEIGQLQVAQYGETLQFAEVHGSLDGRGDIYRLGGFGGVAPWATLDGQLEIAQDAPFRLQGRLDAQRLDAVPFTARLTLGGELAAIAFSLQAEANKANFQASGHARPFPALAVPDLLLAAQGIDPRLWFADAPRADLAITGKLDYRADGSYSGTLRLDNRLAGRLDQGRVPLSHVQTALSGDMERVDFSALRVDLGKAGKFEGRASWHSAGFDLELGGAALDLSGLHNILRPTRLRASMRLAGDLARQTLSAQL
ncbi:MAG: hypothetical protein Q8L69_14795, partial [Gallionellaceae bacterium]|nr:hypothetical protein [Gallionellaceae bacterium]